MKPWEEYKTAEIKPWEEYQAQTQPIEQPTVEQPQIERTPVETFGRQLGLTGRYIAEGAANTLGIIADPLAASSNLAFGTELKPLGQATTSLLNRAGFPSPETGRERNVAEASKLLAGTGGIIGGAANQANLASSTISKYVLNSLSKNAGLQAAGSVGAGYAGSEAREQGASPSVQVAASVAGGLGLPIGVSAIESAGKSISSTMRNIVGSTADDRAFEAITKAGVNLDRLPYEVKSSMIKDVNAAMKTGDNLSPDALRRLADYKLTGLTPMSSSLTLNPAEITAQRNLAKMAANSKDPAIQSLANLQRDNDVKLITNLNTLGASSDDAATAGAKIIDVLNIKDSATKKVIDSYYKQARETTGRSAQLDPYTFTQTANNLLDDALLGSKISSDVRNKLNAIAKGEIPFTVDVAEQLKTNLGTLQRSSKDPAERLALGKVREALENTPLLEGQGKTAIDAFNKARSANRNYMQIVEKTPALKAVRDGVEPDKFVQTYITGSGNKSNIADVAALREALGNNKEAVTTVKGQILAYLKNKATGGSADEVANFSPKSYNDALKSIGDEKMNLFFTPEDIKMLKAIGRVSSYEKFQPTGSAVNNSNTSSALFMSMLDKVANSAIIRKIPFGGALVSDPAKDVIVATQSRNALNPVKGITVKPVKVKSTKNAPIGILLGLGATSENAGN